MQLLISALKKKLKPHKARAVNFVWRLLQMFGKHGFSFINFIIFIEILSPRDFGIYSYMLSSIMLLALFADFGISGSTSKYVAEYSAVSKKKIKYIVWNSGIVIFGAAVLLSAGAILFGGYFFGENQAYILYVLPVLLFSPLVGMYSGIYMGLQRFRYLAVSSLVVGALSIVSNYFLITNYGLVGGLINQSLFYFMLFVVLALGHRDWIPKIRTDIMKPIVKYSLIIGITTLSYYLYSRADIVVLGKFGFIEEVAYYNVLTRVFDMIILPFSIFGQVSGPILAGLYAKKAYAKVRNDFRKMVTLLFIGGAVLSAVLYFAVPFVIQLFFAEYFTEATMQMFTILIFILPLRMVAAYSSAAHTGPTGNAHLSMWPMIVAGIANVLLDIYFIGAFGFIGVVYSTLICYTFAILTFTIRYYIKLNRLSNEKKTKIKVVG